MKKGLSKTEYMRLIRRTETALRRELKKPDAERDEVFVEECLESLSYYRGELSSCRRAAVGTRVVWRTVLASVLALIMTFALGATVAEAAGFRVWTAIFMHDAGYLRVDYVPERTVCPTDHPGWEDEERSFSDYSVFASELDKNGFKTHIDRWNGFEFFEGGIRSTRNEFYSSFSMRADDGYIRVRMIAKRAVEERTSVWGLKEDIPAVHLNINGVDAAYQIDGGYGFATWQEGARIYSVSFYDRVDVIEDFLTALISREF